MGRVNASFAMIDALPRAGDGDRDFALVHIAADRPAVAALWALDWRLGEIVAATTQPMVGQLRLTWWHDALTSLHAETAKGEPVLDALARHALPAISGEDLAGLIDGWEVLLDSLPLPDDALHIYAEQRGVRLFALTARLLGGATDDAAGRGWALANFAARCSDGDTAQRAYAMARDAFAAARIDRLPRALRILARLSRDDAQAGRVLERTRWRLWRVLR